MCRGLRCGQQAQPKTFKNYNPVESHIISPIWRFKTDAFEGKWFIKGVADAKSIKPNAS